MATFIHYSFIVALPGLADWSVFKASFADHVKSQLRQWDPWRELHGRHAYGSEIDPSGT